MELLCNTFSFPALAWSDHSRSPVVVKPGHQVPKAATILTTRYLDRHVIVWTYQDQKCSIVNPTVNDVLGGRGRHSLYHPGNVWFTEIADRFKTEYHFGSATEKTNIILNEVMASMNQQGRRFIKLDVHDRRRDMWKWVIDPNPRAKISNKLRDLMSNAPTDDVQPVIRQALHPMLTRPPCVHDNPPPSEPLVLFEDDLLREVLDSDDTGVLVVTDWKV